MIGLEGLTDEQEIVDQKKRIWATSVRALDRYDKKPAGKNHWDTSASDAPSGEALDEDLRDFQSTCDKSLNWFTKGREDPFIDYSKIEREYRGKGLGGALYIYAARMLGENNQILRASGLQSDDAERLWEKLRNTKNLEVGNTTTKFVNTRNGEPDDPKQVYCLDFRE